MTPYSSDKEKYNTGYFGWLKGYSKYWVSLPFRASEELLEWLQTTCAIIIYIICTLLSPIVFPIFTLYIMVSSKKKMLKDYGEDKLKPINEEK